MLYNVFKDMCKLPRNGIYALINQKKKCVYISHSRNLLTALTKNIKEMQDGVHVYKPLNMNIKDWKFSIIETLSDEDSILDIASKINYHIQEYRNNGYDVKTYKNMIQFRYRIYIGQDYKFYFKLITMGYKKYTMGVFNTKQEAKEFENIYKSMKLIVPVYAINSLTKEYIETLRREGIGL